MITLYHCAAARSFRPLWMLEELGLSYELKMLPFPPRVFAKEYLALNPLGFALVGPLARATSISAVAIGAGVLLTVASLSVIAVPSIRGLRADGTDGSRAVAQ